MAFQSKAATQIALDAYYQAELRCAEGKTFTFSTENGARVYTEQDLPEIRQQITILQRRLTARSGQQHNVAVANFNHSN